MDVVTLLNNNVFVDLKRGELPPIIAIQDTNTDGRLHINDDAAYQLFRRQRTLNENADNIL